LIRRLISLWMVAQMLLFVLLCAGAGSAMAADGDGFSRADFDQIMRWVNLFILVALIVKYARRPFLVFLSGKRAEVAQLIARYESQKRDAEAKIIEAQTLLSAGQERLALIRDKIVEEGRRRQTEIIEDARKESQMMLDSARLKISSQIREAFKQIKVELLDAATHQALTRLPGRITGEDQVAFVQQWLDSAERWTGN
jgi:F-type H+-transporting ATPase subunit b